MVLTTSVRPWTSDPTLAGRPELAQLQAAFAVREAEGDAA